jgi:hypothetical protein
VPPAGCVKGELTRRKVLLLDFAISSGISFHEWICNPSCGLLSSVSHAPNSPAMTTRPLRLTARRPPTPRRASGLRRRYVRFRYAISSATLCGATVGSKGGRQPQPAAGLVAPVRTLRRLPVRLTERAPL